MKIIELHTLSALQEKDVFALMVELDSDIEVSSAILHRAVESPSSHFFAITTDDDHIIGCATLCVFDSPTGRRASVEDVVLSYKGLAMGVASNEITTIINTAWGFYRFVGRKDGVGSGRLCVRRAICA